MAKTDIKKVTDTVSSIVKYKRKIQITIPDDITKIEQEIRSIGHELKERLYLIGERAIRLNDLDRKTGERPFLKSPDFQNWLDSNQERIEYTKTGREKGLWPLYCQSILGLSHNFVSECKYLVYTCTIKDLKDFEPTKLIRLARAARRRDKKAKELPLEKRFDGNFIAKAKEILRNEKPTVIEFEKKLDRMQVEFGLKSKEDKLTPVYEKIVYQDSDVYLEIKHKQGENMKALYDLDNIIILDTSNLDNIEVNKLMQLIHHINDKQK